MTRGTALPGRGTGSAAVLKDALLPIQPVANSSHDFSAESRWFSASRSARDETQLSDCRGGTERPGERVETALYRFADKQAALRRHFEHQRVARAGEPKFAEKSDRARTQGIGQAKREAECPCLLSRPVVEQVSAGIFHRVFDRAAITRVQRGCYKDSVRVRTAGKRQGQAAGKRLSGPVIGMLAPCHIAEPRRRAMEPPGWLREVRKQRRRPLL